MATDWRVLIQERREAREEHDERILTNPEAWEPKSYGFCQGNNTDRVALAATLEALRRRVCPYGSDRCDCKYGLTPVVREDPAEFAQGFNGYEQSGCPELREIIHRLLHRDPPLV